LQQEPLNQVSPQQETTSPELPDNELPHPSPSETNIEAPTDSQHTQRTRLPSEWGHRLLRLSETGTGSGIIERTARYEVILWRQAAQTMLMSNTMQAGFEFYVRTSFRKYPPGWAWRKGLWIIR